MVRVTSPRLLSFKQAIDMSIGQLEQGGVEVDTGHWQGVTTEGHPDLVTIELPDVAWSVSMPHDDPEAYCYLGTSVSKLVDEIRPNLPWSDDHFAERVSRVPSNPGEQYKNWPWWRGQDEAAMDTYTADPLNNEAPRWKKFTHTYQERYWPRHAGDGDTPGGIGEGGRLENYGIRYKYGDLDDLVSLLLREPYTRQAWLPIFFPEDTGAVHEGRVPCTLGYQFMLRDEKLSMWYVIRSCDAVRHYRDDIYLSARLLLWVLEEIQSKALSEGDDTQAHNWHYVTPGIFHFYCFSLHAHRGDLHLLSRKEKL